ncbi:MAG: Bro-N domain-containing protein [bacterium]
MSNNQITLFKYNEEKIRTINIETEVWFVAVDICNALGYTNSRKAISDHCFEDDVTNRYPINDSLGRKQFPTMINESGLYTLIFGSKLETAKAFKKWVTSEVLPTIRKTGSYGTTKSELSPMMARFALNAKKNSVLGYWSMLNKMTELFALPLEQAGLTLPENVIPDISTGRGFCNYLRKQGINPLHPLTLHKSVKSF